MKLLSLSTARWLMGISLFSIPVGFCFLLLCLALLTRRLVSPKE